MYCIKIRVATEDSWHSIANLLKKIEAIIRQEEGRYDPEDTIVLVEPDPLPLDPEDPTLVPRPLSLEQPRCLDKSLGNEAGRQEVMAAISDVS